jgi:hypothetical protein
LFFFALIRPKPEKILSLFHLARWALDWGRDDFGCGKSKHVSVVVTSSRKACFRCGFSVEDEDKAREAFQKMLRAVSPLAEVWI